VRKASTIALYTYDEHKGRGQNKKERKKERKKEKMTIHILSQLRM
jgi:hypothetical protein